MNLLPHGLWARFLDWLADKWKSIRARNTGDASGYEDTQ